MSPLKLIAFFLLIIPCFSSCKKDEVYPASYYHCRGTIPDNGANPKTDTYNGLIYGMISSGVPGVQLAVHNTDNGYWTNAGGFADLASEIYLEPCHITRVGSTVKTFTAVSILLLKEDGALGLDDPVTKYLSQEEIEGLKNADIATIRQLLQHSSGIYNYIQNLKFQTASLNDLIKTWQPKDLLKYARGKKAYFAPGTDVLYSNTNYILLGMIIERVTGKPFYTFFNERIIQPLGLHFTQFAGIDPLPDGIVRGYVDLYSKLQLINATYYSGWDYYTADGGLISNAYDLTRFMTKLFDGEVLSEASLNEMLDWKTPQTEYGDGFKTDYGLGIFRIHTKYGAAYIHSGDAIGYYATMAYFPDQKVTVAWAVNGNYGKVDEFTQSKKAMEQIFYAALH